MGAKTKAIALLTAGVGALAVAGCGSSYDDDTGASAPPGFFITIAGLRFSPLDLTVPPGATVTVVNQDAEAHSVTSAATAGTFTPGSVAGISFDTGAFTGTATFTIPASAAEGAVIPYYCSTHLGTMATPNGTITIGAAAQPAPYPGGGGGGY
jgi:plastocyanin